MGILDFFMGIQEPVTGEYRVTKATKPPTSSSVAMCDMVGELTLPGMPPRVIEHTSPLTSLQKWPRVGDVLPALADKDNPEFMKIEWKNVPAREL
jgi:hypothetical protein